MILDLQHHPDGGCWISDDRVNAFISSKANGVAEIGFHGLQPVSRNSRLLVQGEGLMKVSLHTSKEIEFSFEQVAWTPGAVHTSILDEREKYTLIIGASRRSISLIVVGPPGKHTTVMVRFALSSLFTDVHGNRAWSEPLLCRQELQLECRDRIRLKEWLRREGPYAGDFLIPEPWRRLIFARRCRSGLATINDVHPEYRNADIDLYDARTWLRIGGEHFTATREAEDVLFKATLPGGDDNRTELTIAFAEDQSLFGKSITPPAASKPKAESGESPRIPPLLEIPGHAPVETFFSTVPGIVDSCIVDDIGMSRATPGAYYWIWAWDNMVTALEMPRWGDTATAGRIVRFINSHRDIDGTIPGRWTRDYQPMDTPPAGGLEFLLLLLAANNTFETGDDRDLLSVYPNAAAHLRSIAKRSNERGLAPNMGFYPDLPFQFGRSEQSAVVMETGATYALCRILEVIGHRMADDATITIATELSARIARSFVQTYWSGEKQFLVDSIDLATGKVNSSYPLFSLLFFQTPHSFGMLRSIIHSMARFAVTQFQNPYGTCLLPSWDERRKNEDALSSWYPHWDIYLLKLFRRAKERQGIIAWLRSITEVLDHLGYAPEFLALDGFAGGTPDAWRRHGAYSNLNCATGWYRAIIEGLFGIEFDPGGMTLLPLDLPLPSITASGLSHRGSAWTIRVENSGGPIATVQIDGKELHGCTKVPSGYYDAKPHRIDVSYTDQRPRPLFTELVNAEVLESDGDAGRCSVSIRALGVVDVAFPLIDPLTLFVDGKEIPFYSDLPTNTGYAQLPIYGNHILSLSKPQPL